MIFFDKAYHLILYKIDLVKDALLKDVVHTDLESVDRTTGIVYTVINHNNFFRFQYRTEPTKLVSNIYLTLAGDSLQSVAKNYSVMSYHLLCDNLSMRNAEKGPIDIFMVGEEKVLATTTVIPMDLLFSGSRLKNFVDISELLEHRNLEQLMNAYSKKYPGSSRIIAGNALLYHKEINFSTRVDMLRRPLQWPEIKKRLQNAINEPKKIFQGKDASVRKDQGEDI